MHPAYSVIFFTVSSGAGYGLMFVLGLAVPLDAIPASRGGSAAASLLALTLVVGGLLSSTAHLGHKLRAWRAISQWRSSWLSREGVFALASLPVFTLFALGWVFAPDSFWWRPLAPLSAALAALTVCATAMIYASLKPIRQWHNAYVLPIYLAFGLGSGLMLLNLVLSIDGTAIAWTAQYGLIALAAAVGLKLLYWRAVDSEAPVTGIGTATGLGRFGRVRSLDPPHTSENYLLKEMGYRVARKHAERLRRAMLVLVFAAPTLLTLGALGLYSLPAVEALLASLAAIAMTAGLLLERWLFFAEATHTVQLYYGAERS